MVEEQEEKSNKKNIKDVYAVINKVKEERNSEAKRIRSLFVKHRSWIGKKYKCIEFKEPIMFFERRSGEVEFYEDVTKGIFGYKHSDGEDRFILINPNKQKKFGFADKKFRGYYCHEDHPTPLPSDIRTTAEEFNIAIDKSLHDVKKWKAQEIRANTKLWKTLGYILLGVMGLIILWNMIKQPTSVKEIIREVPVAVASISKNATTIFK